MAFFRFGRICSCCHTSISLASYLCNNTMPNTNKPALIQSTLTLKRSSHLTMHMPSQCNFGGNTSLPCHHLSFCPAARQHIPGISVLQKAALPAIMQSNIFFLSLIRPPFKSIYTTALFISFCDSFLFFPICRKKRGHFLCKTAKYPSYFMQYFRHTPQFFQRYISCHCISHTVFFPEQVITFLFPSKYGLFPMVAGFSLTLSFRRLYARYP